MTRCLLPPASNSPPEIRCAIYTRKSTSEGLDQAFNSLDAQREACAAYIASQKALGWRASPERYDDGGFTGGNIERPAVQRLLEDVQRGQVNCVVVYKVDRLSRSLLDFARIIKLFEDHRVHFVSVTQHFNTADSMGRLTLNILLSFAQFEREIIAERTRDKIAAARRRGQWSGGRPILGYDLVRGEHRLTVNPGEAEQVRAIFGMYLEKESLLTTAQALNGRGWTTKRWKSAGGAWIGGRPFDRSNLRHLLTNVAYIGQVRHRDETHPGQQEAIVDQATWKNVQRMLRRNARTAGSFLRNRHGALLKGLLRCRACDAAMVQMVSRKGPKLHRYYVCTAAQKRGYDSCPTRTILAGRLEQEVCARLRGRTSSAKDGKAEDPAAQPSDKPNGLLPNEKAPGNPSDTGEILPDGWDELPPLDQARRLRGIIETVEYDGRSQRITITLTEEASGQRSAAPPQDDPRPSSVGDHSTGSVVDGTVTRARVSKHCRKGVHRRCRLSSPLPA
jgi:site-specific DNA recombinase